MSIDNTEPNREVRPNRNARIPISLFAAALAVAGGVWSGGVWVFSAADPDTTPPVTVVTSCKEFSADAPRLFDSGDAAALRGTFAAGDHVQLSIDFKGVGYSWKLTGALGKEPKVKGSGTFWTVTRFTPWSSVSHGTINGTARLDVDLDVAEAGDGTITINKTGRELSSIPPRVASASCIALRKPPARSIQANLESGVVETR